LKALFGIQNVWETEYGIRFIQYETDSVFRFKKIFFMKRNTESVSYSMKRILYSVSQKKLQIFWNGIQNPFHTVWNGFCIPFHKKICKFFYETEYRIRFIQFWNWFCIPFIKKFANFFKSGVQNPFHTFLKRILCFV